MPLWWVPEMWDGWICFKALWRRKSLSGCSQVLQSQTHLRVIATASSTLFEKQTNRHWEIYACWTLPAIFPSCWCILVSADKNHYMVCLNFWGFHDHIESTLWQSFLTNFNFNFIRISVLLCLYRSLQGDGVKGVNLIFSQDSRTFIWKRAFLPWFL